MECKNSDKDRRLKGLQAFQHAYPKAHLRVVIPNIKSPYRSRAGAADIQWMGLEDLVHEVGKFFPA